MISRSMDYSLVQILEYAIETGDSSKLLEEFAAPQFNGEKLNSVFSKISEDLANFVSELPEKEYLVTNSLQIIQDLVQVYGRNDTLSLVLVKIVLSLIIDESCSITHFKKGIHVFNLLLTVSTITSIITDESLEGSLQILGRKLSITGDFESQALLYEVLYRITNNENREKWATIWFHDMTARAMFLNLEPQKFELNCRSALNYINRNETERRVFSFVLFSVTFGSMQLKEPFGSQFWVDFNYDSRSISFYCSDFCTLVSTEDSGLWETIIINDSSVKSYSVIGTSEENLQELKLILNYPCHTLITSSVTNSALHSYEVTLTFPEVHDVMPHLEKIYGTDKCVDEYPILLHRNRKVSGLVEAINVAYKELNESCINETFQSLKISQSGVIKITQEISEDFVPDSEKCPGARKISQPFDLINVTSKDILKKLNLENSIKGKKKVSCSSADLKIVVNNSSYLHKARRKKITLKRCSKRKSKLLNQQEVNNDSLESDKAEKLQSNDGIKQYATKIVKKTRISMDVCVNNSDFGKLKECVDEKTLNGHTELLNEVTSLKKANKCEEVAYSSGEQIIVSNDMLTDNLIEDSFVRNNADPGIESMNVPEEMTTYVIKEQGLLQNKDNLEKTNMAENLLKAPQEVSTYVDITKKFDTKNSNIKESNENLSLAKIRKNKRSNNENSEVILDIDVSKQQNIKLQKLDEKLKCIKMQKTEENTKSIKNEEPPTYIKNTKRKESSEIVQSDNDSNDNKYGAHYNNSNKKENPSSNLPTINHKSKNIITNVSQKFNNDENEKKNNLLDEDSLLTENTYLDAALESLKKERKSERQKTLTSQKLSLRSKRTINSEVQISDNQIREIAQEITESFQKISDPGTSKNHSKTKRLYNVEKAPLYDVPPSSQASGEKSGSSKNNTRQSIDSSKSPRNISMFPKEVLEAKDTCKKACGVENNTNASSKDQTLFEDERSDNLKDHSKRAISKRKNSNTDNSSDKRCSQKRNLHASTSQNLEISPKKSRPSRKAAIKSTKKTKDIFHSITSEADDAVESFMSESGSEYGPQTSKYQPSYRIRRLSETDDKEKDITLIEMPKRDYSKSNNVSSDQNINKKVYSPSQISSHPSKSSVYLFSSPKKTSNKRNVSRSRKRKLPVEIVSKSMSTTIVPSSSKKRRRNANNSQSISNNPQNPLLNTKLNSDYWDEVDQYNLVIEKSTRTHSYSVTNLENHFKSLSGFQRQSLVASTMPEETIDENPNDNNNNNNSFLETTANTKGVRVDPYEINIDDDNEFYNWNLENLQYFHNDKSTSGKLPSIDDNVFENLNGDNSKNLHIDKSAPEKSYASPGGSSIDKSAYRKTVPNKKKSHFDEIAYRKSNVDLQDSQMVKNASGKLNANLKDSNVDKIASRKSHAVLNVSHIDKNIACNKSDINSTIDETTSSKSDILQNISKKETSQKKLNLNKSIQKGINKGEKSRVHGKGNSAFQHKDSISTILHEVTNHVYQTADQLEKSDEVQTYSSCEEPTTDEAKGKVEAKGKLIILEKFLESVAVYYNSSPKNSTTTVPASDTDDVTSLHISNYSIFNVTESASLNEDKGTEREYPSNVDTNPVKEQDIGSRKVKIGKKRKSKCAPSDSVQGITRKKHKAIEQSSSEMVGNKDKKNELSKSNNENISLHSKITSLQEKTDFDTKWFNKITCELSQEADTLTRKLLATVQNCFCDYSSKCADLRVKIAKAVEASELPSVLKPDPKELKDLLSSCRSIRIEVEKSLKVMETAAVEYFKAEHLCYKKLGQKGVKSCKKYFSCMSQLEKKAKQRLERRVLLLTNRSLRKLLNEVDCA